MVATVGKISAGAGYSYLTDAVAQDRHDYYTGSGEVTGVWAGSGSAGLGLVGTVDHDVMGWLYGSFIDPRTLGGGIDPATGRPRIMVELGQGLSQPRVINAGTANEKVLEQLAAFDVTFSPSKSVSVLWALAPGEVRDVIVAAHEEAVNAGLEYLEANASHARVGRGGIRRTTTEGFTVAKFRHRTARTTDPERVGDPQLHTHCAILNRVQCADGKWRTLDGSAIYAHAHAAGAVYGTRLEALLSERLGVAWVTPLEGEKVLMREINGVPQPVRDRFSTRRDQVLAYYDRLAAVWRERTGRAPSKTERGQLIEQAKVRSRLGKVKGDGVDLHERWRTQVTTSEHEQVVGVLHQAHAADGGRVAAGPKLEQQVFDALHAERAWWTRPHLYAEVARRIDTPTSEAIELEVERLAQLSVNLEPDHDDAYQQPDRTKFTSPRILDAEARVLKAANTPAPWEVTATPDEILGDDQVAAVDALCAGNTALTTVIGPAGAGKTTMLKSVANSYQHAGRAVTVLTLAAAAARVVTEETGLPAHTIRAWDIGQVTVPRGSLILIDEASMVPTLMLEKLVRVADAYGCRIGLVGDWAQMGSPEAGGLLRDLAASKSAVEMVAVRRFRNEWERDASRQLRTGNVSVAALYEENRRLHGTSADNAVDDIVAAWARDVHDGHESIIVVDNNAQAGDVSARCQQILVEAGRVGHEVAVTPDGCRIRIGDLIQTRHNNSAILNSHGHRILNRDTWHVDGHDPTTGELLVRHARHHATARLPTGDVNEPIQLAYAVTISGAQGRTTDTSHVLVTPRTSTASLYVGMTRGRDSNHAHLVRDGHLHEEFGIGRLTTREAFDAAVARSAHEMSAHRVRDAWQAATPEREQARDADRRHTAAQQWWEQHHPQLAIPADTLAALHHKAIAVLARLDPDKWQAHFASTVGYDWTRPDTPAAFLDSLATGVPPAQPATAPGPHAEAARNWWSIQWNDLRRRPVIERALNNRQPQIVNTLSHIKPGLWTRIVSNTLGRTDWYSPGAGDEFLDRLQKNAPQIERDTRRRTHQPAAYHGPEHGR